MKTTGLSRETVKRLYKIYNSHNRCDGYLEAANQEFPQFSDMQLETCWYCFDVVWEQERIEPGHNQ